MFVETLNTTTFPKYHHRVQHFDASMVYCNVYSRETFLLEHVIFFRNATGIFDSFICDHLFYIAFERATPGFQTSTWIKGKHYFY